MGEINLEDLYKWCSIPAEELVKHPKLKIPLRIVKDSKEMGELMAREFVEEIKAANAEERKYSVIVPCGPNCWYEPFTRIVNDENVSLKNLVVFHMDECLDWQGKLLPKKHPYNFRSFMEEHFYGGILPELSVLEENRYFADPSTMNDVKKKIAETQIDLTLGGWGQDGHVAYNQARRHPYSKINLEQLRNSEMRIQENNLDTIIALANRTFGSAYQFVPPMSITLGLKECFSAKKVRVFSDTGAWKQTALRVALFSEETVEYPMTLLQSHSDVIITATYDTACHPMSQHPEWEVII